MMPVVVEVPLRLGGDVEVCDCRVCDYYGCDCTVTGSHENCECSQCNGDDNED